MYPILFTIKKFNLFGISIGPFHLYSYGAMFVIGFLAAMLLFLKRAKFNNIKKDDVLDLTLYILISGIIGARVSYILIHLNYYSKHFAEIFNLSTGGLALHGGLIAGIIVVILFCKIKKINTVNLFDCIAPSLPLAQAIGRIGCFLNGCCGGITVTSIYAKYIGDIKIFAGRHPVQLYELFLDLLIFILLFLYEKHKKFQGELFLVYLALYCVIRFFLEFLRDNTSQIPAFTLSGFSLGQYVSILIFIPALVWVIIGRVRFKK